MVWGAPEVHGIYEKVPPLRRLARLLRREREIAIILALLLLLTIFALWR